MALVALMGIAIEGGANRGLSGELGVGQPWFRWADTIGLGESRCRIIATYEAILNAEEKRQNS
jgi:hypothetical protein